MDALPEGKSDRIAICDFCHKVERPTGGWLPCRRSSFPPAAFVSDICPTCCEQYVNLLLAPETHQTEGEFVFPKTRQRKAESRNPRKQLSAVRRKR